MLTNTNVTTPSVVIAREGGATKYSEYATYPVSIGSDGSFAHSPIEPS
jgi:hypothetical protein